MPVEVELKARLRDRAQVEAWLSQQASAVASTYDDTYFDFPDLRLEHQDRQELRLRRITTGATVRDVWTFKGAALGDTGVPEFETTVADIGAAAAILRGVGLIPKIAYTKECVNYRFTFGGYPVTATVEHIAELANDYIEVETVVADDADRESAWAVVHAVLDAVGVGTGDLDPTCHIELVRAARAERVSPA